MQAEQPPAKKPRSEAQKAAFERAKAAREQNIIKKHLEATKAQEPEQQPTPEAEQQPVVESPPAPAPTPMDVEEEDEHDYIDFDPEALKQQLLTTQQQVDALKEAMQKGLADLQGRHESLETSWQSHGVKTANMLNFV